MLTRRNLLRAAVPSALLGGPLVAQALNVTPRRTARTCILVNLNGGASHVDTFDVKDGPWLPPDFNAQQAAPNIVLSKTLFPGLSGIGRDLCILRSVQSWEAAHDRGQFYLQTAHSSNPAFVGETPHMGAIVALEKGAAGLVPPFLALNVQTLQGAKFLGGLFEPMIAPLNANGIATLQHNYFGAQSQSRFETRYAALRAIDRGIAGAFADESMSAQSTFYDAAKRMMYQAQVDSIFKFSTAEDQRYGASSFGRSCIIARNAVLADNGAGFINIGSDGWDLHSSMYDRALPFSFYTLCRNLDQGLSQLVADLKTAGQLSSTLIVVLGEFGRTPGQLNPLGGRDHHADAMSVLMIGGGAKGGTVIGATDSTGGQIVDPGWSQRRPIFMEDIAATLYSALGINWTKSLTDTPSGRKFEYVTRAELGVYQPVDEVFS